MPRKLPPVSDEELISILLKLQTGNFSAKNLAETYASRLERERQEKFLQVQARLDRNARSKLLETNPKHVRAQVKRREKRDAKRREDAKKRADAAAAAKLREAERAAAHDGPTRHWRHPRRADWIPPADYFHGCPEAGPRPLVLPVTPAAASNSTSSPAGAAPATGPLDDSRSRNVGLEAES